MKMLIAIDPGKSGAIAVQNEAGTFVFPMREQESDIVAHIKSLKECDSVNPIEVIIEKVGGFTGRPQPGSRMFTFGRGVGVIIGALCALGIPFREVRPQEWQKVAGLGSSKGMTPPQWKRHLKDEATKRFPHLKPTLKTADAILMLSWFRDSTPREQAAIPSVNGGYSAIQIGCHQTKPVSVAEH